MPLTKIKNFVISHGEPEINNEKTLRTAHGSEAFRTESLFFILSAWLSSRRKRRGGEKTIRGLRFQVGLCGLAFRKPFQTSGRAL